MKLMSSSGALMQLATYAGCYCRCQYLRQKPSKITNSADIAHSMVYGLMILENSTLDIPDNTVSSIGSKDDNGGNRRFQCSVQVRETFNIQHVNLIYKQYTWDQLCNALINVFIYHFIYFSSKFIYKNQKKLLVILLVSYRSLWKTWSNIPLEILMDWFLTATE